MKRKIYEQIKGTGTLKNVPASLCKPRIDSGGLLMCPYTNYIPLSYLLMCNNFRPNSRGGGYLKEAGKITKAKQRFYDGGIFEIAEKAYCDYYVNENTPIGGAILKTMMEYVNEYLFFDGALCTYKQRSGSGWNGMRREDIVNGWGESTCQFYQNSYSGFISPYSLYRQIDEIMDVYIPHVLAVVRPEHYFWLKLNFLLTGKIDMSKVVILIDNQLDTTQFPVPAFKSLYKLIKPKILETTAQIWRVPIEFIQENCFLPKFELKEKNILKRKEEINSLIEEFYNSERTNPTAVQPDSIGGIRVGSVGIIEQLRQGAPVTNYTYTDNMQYSTTSTTSYTINTSAVGAELLNAALRTELGVNQERTGEMITVTSPSIELEAYDEDGTNDGPETDGMDEDWEDENWENEDIVLEGTEEERPDLPF